MKTDTVYNRLVQEFKDDPIGPGASFREVRMERGDDGSRRVVVRHVDPGSCSRGDHITEAVVYPYEGETIVL